MKTPSPNDTPRSCWLLWRAASSARRGWRPCPGPPASNLRPSGPRAGRGDGSGQYPAATPVSKWSGKENVLWKTEAGAGHSSPVIAGGRVFVTSEPDQLVCLDLVTGKELWRRPHKLADLPGAPDAKGRDRSSQYGDATPTPVSDGQSVWVFTGTGIVSCHDLDGNRRWMNGYDLRQNTSYGAHCIAGARRRPVARPLRPAGLPGCLHRQGALDKCHRQSQLRHARPGAHWRCGCGDHAQRPGRACCRRKDPRHRPGQLHVHQPPSFKATSCSSSTAP